MGFKIDATKAEHATISQRAIRLGQAMDGNTMRWSGAFLYATQRTTSRVDVDNPTREGFFKKNSRIMNVDKFDKDSNMTQDTMEDNQYQGCAIVEKLLMIGIPPPNQQVGGSDTKNQKKRKMYDVDNMIIEKKIPDHDICRNKSTTSPKSK